MIYSDVVTSISSKNLILILIIVLCASNTHQEQHEITPSYDQRVNLLKFQIAEQIKEKQLVPAGLVAADSAEDDYQYEDTRDGEPITPVMDNDERKNSGNYKLRKLKKTTEAPSLKPPSRPAQRMRNWNRYKTLKPLDTFYRRIFSEENYNKPIDWLHCQDLVSPLLQGYKKEYTKTQFLQPKDVMVQRFIHLLKLNTTDFSKEETYSILYQMSEIPVRLFQWDVNAVSLLIDTIVQGQEHTFRNIKQGITELLGQWRLDIGNTTNLLKQSRIFRPPCIRTSEYGGSTKTSRGQRYTKATSPKTTCSMVPGLRGREECAPYK